MPMTFQVLRAPCSRHLRINISYSKEPGQQARRTKVPLWRLDAMLNTRNCRRLSQVVWTASSTTLVANFWTVGQMQYCISLLRSLSGKPSKLMTPSKYTEVNGLVYLLIGAVLVIWPGLAQTLFIERSFVADEQGLMRALGLTVVVIGWLYFFGGRSGGEQVVAASVIDRLIFVPLVLVPLAIAGVFPHLLLAFAFLDVALALGAWIILVRSTYSKARHASPA